MMRVIKYGEQIDVATDHAPEVGQVLSISQGDTVLADQVASIVYDYDGDQAPAGLRVLVALR